MSILRAPSRQGRVVKISPPLPSRLINFLLIICCLGIFKGTKLMQRAPEELCSPAEVFLLLSNPQNFLCHHPIFGLIQRRPHVNIGGDLMQIKQMPNSLVVDMHAFYGATINNHNCPHVQYLSRQQYSALQILNCSCGDNVALLPRFILLFLRVT